METLTHILSILEAQEITNKVVGNGDVMLTTPQGKSFYFTISTSRWRRKGKTTIYSSGGIEDFLEKYFS